MQRFLVFSIKAVLPLVVFCAMCFIHNSLTIFAQTPQNAPIQAAQTQTAPPKSTAEVPAAFDKDGKLWIITEEMERQYRFFPQYSNVLDARLFQLPDSSCVLEVLILSGSAPESIRTKLSLAELIDLRSRVSDALQSGIQPNGANNNPNGGFGQNQGGGWFGGGFQRQFDEKYLTDFEKFSTVLSATTLGLSYGFLTDSYTGGFANPGFIPGLGVTTIAAPLAFGGGALWATSQPWFNRSSSLMLSNAMTNGLLHGMAGYLVVSEQNAIEGRAIGVSGIVGSLIEGGMTMRLPEVLNLNYGQTVIMTSMGGSGIFTGALASVAAGAFQIDGLGNLSPNALRWTGLASLVGSAGGYFLGYRFGQGQHISAGDGIVLENPASMLTLMPLGAALATVNPGGGAQLPDFRLFAGATIAAQALGYVLGAELIRNKDFSFQQGLIINQATSLGATVGLIPLYAGLRSGLAVYAPLLSAVGGGVGFAIGYINAAKQAEAYDKARKDAETKKSSARQVPFNENFANNNAALDSDEQENTPRWLGNIFRHTDIKFSPFGFMGALHPVMGFIGANTPILSIRANLGAMEKEESQWQEEAVKREVLSALPR